MSHAPEHKPAHDAHPSTDHGHAHAPEHGHGHGGTDHGHGAGHHGEHHGPPVHKDPVAILKMEALGYRPERIYNPDGTWYHHKQPGDDPVNDKGGHRWKTYLGLVNSSIPKHYTELVAPLRVELKKAQILKDGREVARIEGAIKALEKERDLELIGAMAEVQKFYGWKELDDEQKKALRITKERLTERKIERLNAQIREQAHKDAVMAEYINKLLVEENFVVELKKQGVTDPDILEQAIFRLRALQEARQGFFDRTADKLRNAKTWVADHLPIVKNREKKGEGDVLAGYDRTHNLPEGTTQALQDYTQLAFRDAGGVAPKILADAAAGNTVARQLVRENFTDENGVLLDDGDLKKAGFLGFKNVLAKDIGHDFARFVNLLPSAAAAHRGQESIKQLHAVQASDADIAFVLRCQQAEAWDQPNVDKYLSDHGLAESPVGLKIKELTHVEPEKVGPVYFTPEQLAFVDRMATLIHDRRGDTVTREIFAQKDPFMVYLTESYHDSVQAKILIERVHEKYPDLAVADIYGVVPTSKAQAIVRRLREMPAPSATDTEALRLLTTFYASGENVFSKKALTNYYNTNKSRLSDLPRSIIASMVDEDVIKAEHKRRKAERVEIGGRLVCVGDKVRLVGGEFVNQKTGLNESIIDGTVESFEPVVLTKAGTANNPYQRAAAIVEGKGKIVGAPGEEDYGSAQYNNVRIRRQDGVLIEMPSLTLPAHMMKHNWTRKVADVYIVTVNPTPPADAPARETERYQKYEAFKKYMTDHVMAWLEHPLSPAEIKEKLIEIKTNFGITGLEQIAEDPDLHDTWEGPVALAWRDILMFYQTKLFGMRERIQMRVIDNMKHAPVDTADQNLYRRGYVKLQESSGATTARPVIKSLVLDKINWEMTVLQEKNKTGVFPLVKEIVPVKVVEECAVESFEPSGFAGDVSGILQSKMRVSVGDKGGMETLHITRRVVDGTIVVMPRELIRGLPDAVKNIPDDSHLWFSGDRKINGYTKIGETYYIVENGVASVAPGEEAKKSSLQRALADGQFAQIFESLATDKNADMTLDEAVEALGILEKPIPPKAPPLTERQKLKIIVGGKPPAPMDFSGYNAALAEYERLVEIIKREKDFLRTFSPNLLLRQILPIWHRQERVMLAGERIALPILAQTYEEKAAAQLARETAARSARSVDSGDIVEVRSGDRSRDFGSRGSGERVRSAPREAADPLTERPLVVPRREQIAAAVEAARRVASAPAVDTDALRAQIARRRAELAAAATTGAAQPDLASAAKQPVNPEAARAVDNLLATLGDLPDAPKTAPARAVASGSTPVPGETRRAEGVVTANEPVRDTPERSAASGRVTKALRQAGIWFVGDYPNICWAIHDYRAFRQENGLTDTRNRWGRLYGGDNPVRPISAEQLMTVRDVLEANLPNDPYLDGLDFALLESVAKVAKKEESARRSEPAPTTVSPAPNETVASKGGDEQPTDASVGLDDGDKWWYDEGEDGDDGETGDTDDDSDLNKQLSDSEDPATRTMPEQPAVAQVEKILDEIKAGSTHDKIVDTIAQSGLGITSEDLATPEATALLSALEQRGIERTAAIEMLPSLRELRSKQLELTARKVIAALPPDLDRKNNVVARHLREINELAGALAPKNPTVADDADRETIERLYKKAIVDMQKKGADLTRHLTKKKHATKKPRET